MQYLLAAGQLVHNKCHPPAVPAAVSRHCSKLFHCAPPSTDLARQSSGASATAECTVANVVEVVLVADSMDGLGRAMVTGIHRMAAAPVARRMTQQAAAESFVTVDLSIGQHEQEMVDLQLSDVVRVRSGDMLLVALLQQNEIWKP